MSSPAQPSVTSVTTAAPIVEERASYDAAMTWLKSNPGFRFALKERNVVAEGELKRPRVGMEVVTFKAEGAEWRGEAGLRGVVWSMRNGNSWKEATPPEYAARMYQRVTVAFDPQKKEGTAQLASSDANANVYRFTDANTGNVHEIRVNRKDAHIESMKIGDDVELTVKP
ncbi:MAG TPA: hypothetical protein VHW00_00960 [Thermoanaerobaculia bacterium]|nr:hypothetical protein [Thermoanaerobaculia bacterium]